MTTGLAGKVVIVTGAAGGHGRALARMLAAQDARPVLADRDRAVQAVAASIPGGAPGFEMDVADERGWAALVEFAQRELGGIDGLINNAGIAGRETLMDLTPARLQTYLDVNLVGALNGIRAVVPVMKARGGGAIVNVASVAATQATPGLTGYGISKWALRGLGRNAAAELAPHSIRVNTILPGASAITMIADGDAAAGKDAAASQVPLGRVAEADEIASAIQFALSDAAAYVTGSEIVVDGGWTA